MITHVGHLNMITDSCQEISFQAAHSKNKDILAQRWVYQQTTYSLQYNKTINL